MVRALGLLLFLHPAPLHCKLILLSPTPPSLFNASELAQTAESHAEILNTSLQRFDNFTLCARYRITRAGHPKSSRLLLKFQHSVRFITFNFLMSSETQRYRKQYIFNYQHMPLLGMRKSNIQP